MNTIKCVLPYTHNEAG